MSHAASAQNVILYMHYLINTLITIVNRLMSLTLNVRSYLTTVLTYLYKFMALGHFFYYCFYLSVHTELSKLNAQTSLFIRSWSILCLTSDSHSVPLCIYFQFQIERNTKILRSQKSHSISNLLMFKFM